MTNDDKPMFVAAITELAALKPNAKLTADSYAAWWNAMRERWTLDEFKAACARLRDTCEFMPNPFHFEQLRKAGRMTAGEAFARAREVMRQAHPSYSISSGDALIDAAARACGGYFAMGQTNTDKIGWLEKRFAEHYDAINDAEDVRESVPQLTGPPRHPGGPKSIAKLLERV